MNDKFTDEEVENSLLKLNSYEILKMAQLSPQYNRIITSNSFWCKMLKRDFNVTCTTTCFIKYNKQQSIWERKIIFAVIKDNLKPFSIEAIFKDYDNAISYGKDLTKKSNYSDDVVHIYSWQQGIDLDQYEPIVTILGDILQVNSEEYNKMKILQRLQLYVEEVYILKDRKKLTTWYEKKADAEQFRMKGENVYSVILSDDLYE